MLAAGLSFGVGWITYRYQCLYIYAPVHEAGGRLWPLIFDYAILGARGAVVQNENEIFWVEKISPGLVYMANSYRN